jgi:alpha-tubulin suppressor-like RCC1 family protein
MTINRATLITCLQSAMDDYIFGSSAVADVLNHSLTSWALGEVNNVVVNTIEDLPNLELYDSPDAILCFVQNLDVFVISSLKRWITLDGRVVRDDSGRLPGYVWSWGSNETGQLGDNSTLSKSSPVSIVGGFSDWCMASAGESHIVAQRHNSSIWSWGCNSSGQLGNNSTADRSSPVSVTGAITSWCQVSAGVCHTMAVSTAGTAWSWGNAVAGKLGDNTTVNKSSPVIVAGNISDWCMLSAGSRHSLGISATGGLWAWGGGGYGALGNNCTVNASSPVSVVTDFSDWCLISANGTGISRPHSLALRSNGTAWTWGHGQFGRLGDGGVTDRSSPVSVVGNIDIWCQGTTGQAHTTAVTTTGSIWAWGYGRCGRLGDGTTTNRSSPVIVTGGITSWCSVDAGAEHTVAVQTDGTAWAWGCNGSGRLGDGTTITKLSPVSVTGGFCEWCMISSGRASTLGVRAISC